MWKKNKRERDLCGVGAEVAPETPEMTGPGNPARMNQEPSSHVQVNRKCNHEKDKEGPEQRRARKERARSSEPQKQRWRNQTAPQVVEDLPARHHRQHVVNPASLAIEYSRKEPANDLPVAACPAMCALC